MIILNLLITFFLLAILSFTDLENTSQLAIIGIFQYIWMFYSWYSITRNLMNVYLFFLVLSFFFYLGQPILALLNIDISAQMTIQSSPFSIADINKTLLFLLAAMSLFHFGALLSVKNYKYDLVPPVNAKIITFVGMLLFAISFIPALTAAYDSLKTTLTMGYSYIFYSDFATGTGMDGGIPKFLSTFFKASLFLLIIGNINNKNKLRFWILFTLFYFGISIISGQRGGNSLFIIGLIMLYHYAIKPFTKKHAYRFIGVLVLSIIALSVISTVRDLGIGDLNISNVIKVILENQDGNPLTSLIGEMGFTLIACTTVMVYCPSLIPFNLGASYYNSLFSLIPNLFWEINPAANGGVDAVFKHLLFQKTGIGSSFIIEAYYNFGLYGLLLMPLLGYLMGKLYFHTIQASKSKNYLKLYICVYTSSFVLWYVRSETITFYRNFAYYALLPVLLIILISSMNKKLSRQNFAKHKNYVGKDDRNLKTMS